MATRFQCAAAVVIAILALAEPRARAAPAGTRVDVALLDEASVPAATLDRARAVAWSIFDRAGVRIVWLDAERRRCLASLPPDARGRQALYASLYAVRIVREPAGTRRLRRETLGSSWVGTRTATVFHGGVELHAREAGADEGLVLGSVVAHELGHLLLGRAAHAAAGVMGPRLDLPLAEQGRLFFTGEEAATMAARAATASGPC